MWKLFLVMRADGDMDEYDSIEEILQLAPDDVVFKRNDKND